MKYMINVDLKSKNLYGDVTDGCPSELHRTLDWHLDLTVHEVNCGCRNSRSVHNPPTRYWDHNMEKGYTLAEVIERIAFLQRETPDAHPRRCSRCDVPANPPLWD